MEQIHWTEDLRTGNVTIDADHMHLISLLNLVAEVCKAEKISEIDEILFALIAYVTGHFAREEKIISFHFPEEIAAHRGAHELMSSYAYDMSKRISSASNNEAKLELLQQLYYFLSDWLLNHIKAEDTKLRTIAT